VVLVVVEILLVLVEVAVLALDVIGEDRLVVLPGIPAELHVKVPPSRTRPDVLSREIATPENPGGLYTGRRNASAMCAGRGRTSGQRVTVSGGDTATSFVSSSSACWAAASATATIR